MLSFRQNCLLFLKNELHSVFSRSIFVFSDTNIPVMLPNTSAKNLNSMRNVETLKTSVVSGLYISLYMNLFLLKIPISVIYLT